MISVDAKWKTWWEINRWRFTWTPQRSGVKTGNEFQGEGNLELETFLVQCLQHKNFDVRGAAALALGRAGSSVKARVVAPLEIMTRDSNNIAAESAVLALGMLGSQSSVPKLLAILENKNGNHRLRAHAAIALGLVGEKSTSRAMIQLVLKRKVHAQVRAACLMGLALMKEEAALPVLLTLMSNRAEKEDLRAMAVTALGKMGFKTFRKGRRKIDVVHVLANLLRTTKNDKKVKLSAVQALSALGPSEKISADSLIDRLGSAFQNQKSNDLKGFILMGIAELGVEGRPLEKARMLFRNVLRGERNPSLLSFACLAAGISKDANSLRFVRKIFRENTNPELQSAAAVGLGLLGDVESTRMLVNTVTQAGDPELKGYCCIALGLMGAKGNKEALPVLREVLAKGNIPELRAAAAMALTLLGDRNAVDILIKAVEEGNSYLRMSILMAIGYFRDMGTIKPLMNLFHSQKGMNDEIRAITLTAIGYIIEESETPILKKLATHYNYLLTKYDALLQIVKLL
jgi:HEAT repeat protein